jgi:hypothetical protein
MFLTIGRLLTFGGASTLDQCALAKEWWDPSEKGKKKKRLGALASGKSLRIDGEGRLGTGACL